MANDGARTGPKRLTADDWATAAFAALESGGLPAVAVEPLAKRLGATKGSFYWHFKDRAALVEAALAKWEQLGTEQVIADAAATSDPHERLHLLFGRVIDYAAHGRVDLALLAAADQPSVAAALRRVADRRIAYVTELLIELGHTPDQAHTNAVVAVSVYHGFNQLVRVGPTSVPDSPEERRALVDHIFRNLLTVEPRPE
ncbi:TetR/AcrR family transcriptional regulator [Nocardia thailandica]